jgi:lantibiotic modifying enzyme
MRVIRGSFCLWLTFILPALALAQAADPMKAALGAERWLSSQRKSSAKGYYWPNVRDSSASSLELYSGNSGVLLFYLELFAATGEQRYGDVAMRTADHIVASVSPSFDANTAGLYTGQAGLIYALHRADMYFMKNDYKQAVHGMLDSLATFVHTHHDDPEMANDIVYGWAGIGLTFLYAEKEGIRSDAGQLAQEVGKILLSRQVKVNGGVRWPMFMSDTTREFYMPNFSHGTAGVAYFLAKLYDYSGDKECLEASREAANYLLSITTPEGLIRHAEPDSAAMSRYYVSWCHGPAGTARLYHALWNITGDSSWRKAMLNAAHADLGIGIPEQHTEGYWNNVSFCCGDAGVAAFYLDMFKSQGDSAYLDFANRMLDSLAARADVRGGAWQWEQAENRRQPDLIQAQTGLMQGAAGIGLAFLRADAMRKGRRPVVRLPDDPF